MNKKWLIISVLALTTIFVTGIFSKRSSEVQPLGNFYKKNNPQNTCLTNEEYGVVTNSGAPVLSTPFDPNDYSTKYWGIVPFCANLRNGNTHGGLDFELKPNSKVYFASDGVVEKTYVGREEGSGEIVSVSGDGFSLGYSGLTNLQVRAGDEVKTGDYIGDAVRIPHGEYHVHFGVTINGKAECPIKYMDEEFLAAFKEMFARADYGSQTDASCACDCESFAPNY